MLCGKSQHEDSVGFSMIPASMKHNFEHLIDKPKIVHSMHYILQRYLPKPYKKPGDQLQATAIDWSCS